MFGGKTGTQAEIDRLSTGQKYYGLKQAWIGYRKARVDGDKKAMLHYNEGIQKFKHALNLKGVAKPMPKKAPQFVNGLRTQKGKKFVVEAII